MITTIEAEIDASGQIHTRESVVLEPGSRVLLTILPPESAESALLSEVTLAVDWDRPEEDAAWALGPNE